MIKICDTCGEEKKHIYFYFDYNNADNRKSSCIACDKKLQKINRKKELKRIKEDERRDPSGKELILYKRKSATKLIKSVYTPENIPLFMQFNQLIYNYVKEKHGLSFSQLNLLLFVFPLAPFPRKDFLGCRELMGFKEAGLMKFFIDNDFIYIWKKAISTERTPTLYDITTKGKSLIRDIHEWALGRKEIPNVDSVGLVDLLARIRGF